MNRILGSRSIGNRISGNKIFAFNIGWAGAILLATYITMAITTAEAVSADIPSNTESAQLLEKKPIEAGRVLYQQNCASCHGKKAEGAPDWKRPNALGDMPAPPHNSSGHSWRHSDADLSKMISKGLRDPFNKTKQLTMPAFNETLSTKEIDTLIAYLKTLWTAEQRQFQLRENQRPPRIR